jgi:hypothetical protein
VLLLEEHCQFFKAANQNAQHLSHVFVSHVLVNWEEDHVLHHPGSAGALVLRCSQVSRGFDTCNLSITSHDENSFLSDVGHVECLMGYKKREKPMKFRKRKKFTRMTFFELHFQGNECQLCPMFLSQSKLRVK